MRYRYAIVRGYRQDIAPYLPSNFQAIDVTPTTDPDMEDVEDLPNLVLVIGEDVAGWTLDEYVIPRLGSGLHFATELVEKT